MDETRSAERQGCADAASDTLFAGGPLAVQPARIGPYDPPGGHHRTLAGACSSTSKCSGSSMLSSATVRARPGRLSALTITHSESVWCGAFVWARTEPKRRFRPGQSVSSACLRTSPRR